VDSGGLLGRDSELSRLTATIEQTSERGSVVLLVGEPGIGKSSLLAVARQFARTAGFTVLTADGNENEMHLPFGGLQQLVSPLTESIHHLPPGQRDALETAIGLSIRSRPDLFLIAEATFNLIVSERSHRPVVIVADDVQWLDPQSDQILAFLAHRSAGGEFSVIAAVRPDHPGPFADAEFPRLSVEGLDDQTAEHMLKAHAATFHPTELKRIQDEAAGNPLALLELPRSWGDGPTTADQAPALSARLEHAFAGRVTGLPPETQDILLLAALSSSTDPAEVLAAMSGLDSAPASVDFFQPAVAAGLISDATSSIAFRHPLVRSSILHRESMDRRHAAHRALADVLVADSFRSSWHRAWSIVGPDDAIADELAETISEALQRGAVMSAVSILERSAQLTTSAGRRGERLLQAAIYAFGVGRADVVARLLREASTVDLTELDLARFAWLSEALNGNVSSDSACVRQLTRSAESAIRLGDHGLALDLLSSAGIRTWWAKSGDDDRTRILEVLDTFAAGKSDPRHPAAVSLAEPLLRYTEVRDRLATVDFDEIEDGNALRMYGMAAYCIGDYPLAIRLLDGSESIFRSQGRLGLLPVVLGLQVHIRLDLGDWPAAAAAVEDVNSISRETGQAVFAENNVLEEARVIALQGSWKSALELMAAAESEAMEMKVNDRICLGYLARGAALLSADRPDDAFDCLRRQYDPADPGYQLRESIGGIALMAEAAVESQHVDQARQIVESFELLFMVAPSPILEMNLLYARALLGPDDQRDALFQVALRSDLSDWPWFESRLQLEYGRWLLSCGRTEEARTYLTKANAVFERIGAARWRRRASSALAFLNETYPQSPFGDEQP
jgi:tetratricopeptide (TPR) repeat protein